MFLKKIFIYKTLFMVFRCVFVISFLKPQQKRIYKMRMSAKTQKL